MANAAFKLMTMAEFLEFDDGTGRRFELRGGQPVMMASPARLHCILVSRVTTELRNRLRPPCEPEVEAGVLLPWTASEFFVADFAVSCEAPVSREQWCPNPVLIVEVLPPSTERDDRSEKLPAYRRLPSVQDALLVASTERAVEHWQRSGPACHKLDLGPGDAIRLGGLGIEFPLDELYAGLPLGPEEAVGG